LVRLINGPPKPWQDRLTSALTNPLPEPSYIANAGRWGQLLDADLEAAFQAARADIPGPAPLPRQQMLNNVLAWQQAQEVALAWAVVKYAELVSDLAGGICKAWCRCCGSNLQPWTHAMLV
jgi:hypothetical protein